MLLPTVFPWSGELTMANPVTVADLRRMLASMPDDTEVVIEVTDEEEMLHQGSITSVSLEDRSHGEGDQTCVYISADIPEE